MPKEVWTIGHSTHDIETFVDLLERHNIDLLVDIRSYPGSRHCPQFNQSSLMTYFATMTTINYLGLSTLGGRRGKSSNIDPELNAGWRNASFKNYADYITTYPAGFDMLESLCLAHRVAYMCSEQVPWKCHRSIVSDVMMQRDWQVHHIMPTTCIQHRRGAWGPMPSPYGDSLVRYPEGS